MVTPFDEKLAVDYDRAAELAAHLVAAGSDGLVVSGTTGESPTLTDEEKIRLFQTVIEAVGDRAFVWCGTSSYDTAASVRLSLAAAEAGAAGLLLVAPYYNKPPQEGLIHHFRTIADAVDLPVLLYNVPGRTSTNMLPTTVARLAEHPRIVGIKEASGDIDQASEIRRLCPEDFILYSGDDSMTLPMMAVGGEGVISVASHVAAGSIAEMVSSFRSGDIERARNIHLRLLPLFRALFVTANPIPVKVALELSGFPVGGTRPPLVADLESIRLLLQRLMSDVSDLVKV